MCYAWLKIASYILRRSNLKNPTFNWTLFGCRIFDGRLIESKKSYSTNKANRIEFKTFNPTECTRLLNLFINWYVLLRIRELFEHNIIQLKNVFSSNKFQNSYTQSRHSSLLILSFFWRFWLQRCNLSVLPDVLGRFLLKLYISKSRVSNKHNQ